MSFEAKARQYRLYDRIDRNEGYSPEYKEKLKKAYRFFKKNGYEFTEHGLGRALNPKSGRGKKPYTLEDVLAVLKLPVNYVESEAKSIKYYDNSAVIQGDDTGEVISVIYKESPKAAWKEVSK